MKHTPSPWIAGGGENCPAFDNKPAPYSVVTSDGELIALCGANEDARNDAILIAVVPDFYAVVKKFLRERSEVANHPDPEIRLSIKSETLLEMYDAVDRVDKAN